MLARGVRLGSAGKLQTSALGDDLGVSGSYIGADVTARNGAGTDEVVPFYRPTQLELMTGFI